MEPLLKKSTLEIAQLTMDRHEECPISGEYTLPEYCSDVAVVLKCFAYPHIQSRQWNGEQFLVDGSADIRVLYLDEERQAVRALEFVQPFSCSIHGNARNDNTEVELHLSTKYLTCRAVSPRRIEVRGAITVTARAECASICEIVEPLTCGGFYTRTDTLPITVPMNVSEKVISVNENFEFDSSLPPAEMLLGGECRAVVKECKILSGKVIVKGLVYIHQLYTDSVEGKHTHTLDFNIPFSQIMDVPDVREGMSYKSSVLVLSDMEKCSVGPDGENTVLDVNIKMLLRVQAFKQTEIALLRDAFHCRFPVVAKVDELCIRSLLGQQYEEVKLFKKVSVPSEKWKEIIDVWVQVQDIQVECVDGCAKGKGHLQIGVIARDMDDEIVYREYLEEYSVEHKAEGNTVEIQSVVSQVHFRMIGDVLELEIVLAYSITDCMVLKESIISDLHPQAEAPFPKNKVNALLYYANRGEMIWNIGRECHASPDTIQKENSLNNDVVVDPCILLVPIEN